jgi:hypothetical protein
MRTVFKKVALALGVFLSVAVLAMTASAECGNLARPRSGATLKPQSGQDLFQSGALLSVNQSNDSIVGMWQVKLIAKGNGPDGPPDDAPIDSAIVQWHADGTELMNSGRPAQDGNFCMGVWQRVGGLRYKLNHFALGNDTANAPGGVGNPAGPTHIRQDIFLSRNGNSYAGTFILDAYDTSGNQVAHIVGVVSGTRITVNTPVTTFFQ